jgi:hypothetical protein
MYSETVRRASAGPPPRRARAPRHRRAGVTVYRWPSELGRPARPNRDRDRPGRELELAGSILGPPDSRDSELAEETWLRLSGPVNYFAMRVVSPFLASLSLSSALCFRLSGLKTGFAPVLNKSNICKRFSLPTSLKGGCASMSMSSLPESSYWQGGTTLKVSKQIHVENRARVISHLSGSEDNSFIFLAGGVQLSRADTDHELLFR